VLSTAFLKEHTLHVIHQFPRLLKLVGSFGIWWFVLVRGRRLRFPALSEESSTLLYSLKVISRGQMM
jgi:hypothetical protein